MKYFVVWKNLNTGETSRGLQSLPREVALAWVDQLNRDETLRETHVHWLEPEDQPAESVNPEKDNT